MEEVQEYHFLRCILQGFQFQEMGLSLIHIYLWALFNSLSNEEQGEMAQKTKLWKRPDYRVMVQEGTPKEVCFWQCQMRKAVVSRPKMDAATYVKFVIEFKADIEACNSICLLYTSPVPLIVCRTGRGMRNSLP